MRKVNFSHFLLACALASALLSCRLPLSFGDPDPEDGPAKTESWQAEVDALKRLTRSQPIPNFLTDPEAPQTGEVFDPNLLLALLDHLALQPGYTLDFVYHYDGIGGKPFIYARALADPPFENTADYHAAISDKSQHLEYVIPDGTEQGYFQWVLLSVMGDQFYLYWHAGYHDTEIIASRDRLEALVGEMSASEIGQTFTHAQQRQALQIDPAPVVAIKGETVTVRVVTFTKWGGFDEAIYTLSAAPPYQILDQETHNLMPYDCGILY